MLYFLFETVFLFCSHEEIQKQLNFVGYVCYWVSKSPMLVGKVKLKMFIRITESILNHWVNHKDILTGTRPYKNTLKQYLRWSIMIICNYPTVLLETNYSPVREKVIAPMAQPLSALRKSSGMSRQTWWKRSGLVPKGQVTHWVSSSGCLIWNIISEFP